MTKEPIPITTTQMNDQEVETANARALHEYLESGQHFSIWIKNRIDEYGFLEGQDFVCVTNLLSKNGSGGHNRVDYHITLDMAKELAMVERTEKGRMARRYFIECEKRLRQRRGNFLPDPAKGRIAPYETACKQYHVILKMYKGMGFPTAKAIERAKKVMRDSIGIDLDTLFPPEPLLGTENGGSHVDA